jgi:flagellar hook-associated protein 2
VSGLISGIDSTSIINALVAADGASTQVIKSQQAIQQAKLDALHSFNTKVLSAQLDLDSLKRQSTFQARKATSSSDSALSATSASSSAVPGTYTLDVVKVAQAHQLATAGSASATAPIGTGTVSIQVGSAPATTLDFSAGGSLNDVATAINNANLGAIASVVNDGTGTPYRLVLQSTQTGTANTVLVNGTGDFNALFSSMSTLTAPSDAKVRIGGATGITITQASNTFTDVVPGVSLVAKSEQNGVSITVASDSTDAQAKLTTFVNDLNTAITYFNQNSAYDPTTKQGGVLIAESSLRSQLSSIQRALTSAIPGQSSYNNLSAIGITIDQKDGTFAIDNAKLTAAMNADPNSIMRLFTNTGTSSNSAVQFSFLSAQTKVDQPFTVNVTQAASQAVVGTTGDLADSTVIDGSNDQLALTINGSGVNLTLTHGTYSRSQIAQLLQTSINAAAPGQNQQVTVSLNGNRLDLRSTLYGSGHSLQVTSTGSAAALGLSTITATGTDVAGTIDGVAATGNGQVLKGAASTPADGLSLLVTATVPVSGVTVTAHKGVAQQASDIFSRLTDSSSGSLATKEASLTTNINDLDGQVTKQNKILDARRQYYQTQFTAMEKLIAQFQGQGTYITQLTNALTKSSSSS